MAAKTVPVYCTLGFALPANKANPNIATSWNPIKKTPLLFTRSANQLAIIVKKHAHTYGGTDMSCALLAVYPMFLTMVGRKRAKE